MAKHIHVYIHLYYILFIHSYLDGDLGHFHVLAIVNSAAMNIGMPISFQFRVFFGYMSKATILF